MTARIPTPAYQDTGVLYGEKELYARIGKIAEGDGGKKLVEEFEIPIRSGKAWVVKKGTFLEGGRSRNGKHDDRQLRRISSDIYFSSYLS